MVGPNNINDDTDYTVTIETEPVPAAQPSYGTVTISPNHGTASPSTFSADGTSHTITITPASGYTTTGMTPTSNNNDISATASGNTIIVTGTSSNNATITVTLPAEGGTPSGNTAVITVNPSYACDGLTEVRLVSHEDASKFMNTAHNLPWVDIPVACMEGNVIRVFVDPINHSLELPQTMTITYIYKPAKFATGPGTSENDYDFGATKFELSDTMQP